MPQLDTMYLLTTYLWTWTMLYLMMKKIKTISMTMNPTTRHTSNKLTPTLPWL